jgi:UDP-glucose 4-epimerase
MRPRTSLVTGADGFIGRHLTTLLSRLGDDIILLDRSFPKGLHGDKCGMDLARDRIPVRILEKVDMVWHLAAESSVRTPGKKHVEDNIIATFRLLEAMAESKVKSIVFLSSSVVYGDPRVMPTPETEPLAPISVYGATKAACEQLLSAYRANYGLNLGIVRLANVVGRDGHGVVNDLLAKLAKNPNELEVLGDGSQKKSYLHIDDCLSGLIKVGKHVISGGSLLVNLGSADSITVDEVAELVLRERGTQSIPLRHVPAAEGRGWPGDVKAMWLDIASAARTLDWRPRFTSEEAVVAVVSESRFVVR